MRRLPSLFSNPLLIALPLGCFSLFAGCSGLNSSREDRHKTELSLHKMRTDVEDLKHDLNTSGIELHILEGKLIDQEETIGMLKEQMIGSQSGKLEDLQQLISGFNKKIASIEKKQEELVADLRQLANHANETTTALAQYKDKICEMEKILLVQNKKFEEIAKLRKSLDALAVEAAKSDFISYTIKEGDSLQKISKQYSVSVDDLKKVNHLKDDLIFSGQVIMIPKASSSNS